MTIPLVPHILESVALSISIYFCITNLINNEFKLTKLLKYLAIVSLPIIILVFNNSLLFFSISKTLLVLFAIKFVLKTNYKDIIIPFLLAFTIYQLVLNAYSSLLNEIGILNLTLNNQIYYTIIFVIAAPLSVVAISYILKRFLSAYMLTGNLQMFSTAFYSIICTYLVFLLSLSSLLSPYYMTIFGNFNIFNTTLTEVLLNAFFVVNLALLYSSLKNYYEKQITEVKNQALIESSKEMQELNRDLRSQKHDFFNHLQVISGLLQLKKHSECFNYVIGIYNNDQSRASLRTGLISINALLNSKQLRAKNKNIRIDLDIATELDNSKFKIHDWEITKVLGNLIDNAIFEETKVSTKDKYIKVKIGEDTEHYSFTVYNKNSFIDHDKRSRIFSSGFSTKGKDGHGMGLYIVKNIVDKHKGKIHLESHIGSGTKFSLFFPKNAELNETQFSELKCYPPQESLHTQTN